MENTKICNRCGLVKTLDGFWNDKRNLSGRYSICKKCKTESTIRWRTENREKYNAQMRAYNQKHRFRIHLKQQYGIGLEDYENLKMNQDSKCAICERMADRLVVDHCHNSGRIRGLLCYSCNRSISIFEHAKLIDKVMRYLIA